MKFYRKALRLREYDYNLNGLYFVTICSNDKIKLFGKIEKEKMHFNEIGEIVNRHLIILAKQYNDVYLHNYVIMPNHLHLIIELRSERIACVQQVSTQPNINRTKMKLCKLVQILKSSITKEIRNNSTAYNTYLNLLNINYNSLYVSQVDNLKVSYLDACNASTTNNTKLTIWQHSFHEHIIRDSKDYEKISNYIDINPIKWQYDCFYN